ncbi:MAG: enoyl-CoA hydratase/isomerase family protein [Deltaproteobacteria bacterium]|nr:enoyl-CoA hydratase/isomerase family protein [Deltaproteobacteria bacterium]
MVYENILLEKPEEGIYLLTVNRPKALNALNGATLDELAAAIAEVGTDPTARVLLVTGAGEKAFVAGADISAMKDQTPLEAKEFSLKGLRTFRSLENLPLVTIAVVNGFCLGGGCELAMSCDWILASDRALFGQPEVNLGVIPGFGGTQRLQRLIGRNRALELITTARNVKADEALALGLVNHVHPAENLHDEALAMARTVASKGPAALRLAKEAVQRGQDLDLDNGCVLESDLFALCFATQDQKEGMGAFLEKRKAHFQGR